MRKITLLLTGIFILNVGQIFAQNQTDSIRIEKRLGIVFIQDGKLLTPKQLLEITKINHAAYEEMRVAKTYRSAAMVLGYAGGFLIGWPLGTALGGGEPNWTLAGVGAGLILLAIPLSISYSKHAKEAVGIYNSVLGNTGLRKIKFDLGLTYNGIGIKMTF